MKKLLFSLTLFVMVGGGCEAAHAQTLQPQGGTMVRPGSIAQSPGGMIERPGPRQVVYQAVESESASQGRFQIKWIRQTFDPNGMFLGGECKLFVLGPQGPRPVRMTLAPVALPTPMGVHLYELVPPQTDNRPRRRVAGIVLRIGDESAPYGSPQVGYALTYQQQPVGGGVLMFPREEPREFLAKEVGGQIKNPDKPHNPKFPVSGVHDPNPPVGNDEPAPDPRMPQVYKHRRK